MSASTAELTLILKAKNLADVELGKIRAGMEKIATTASVVAADVAAAFQRIGRRIANQMGNVAQDIFSGGNLGNSLLALGATMAGAIVEGLGAHFIPMVLEKMSGTAVFGPVITALTTEGASLGSVLSGAIATGMAALPFLLAAAAVAALVYLIANPEARQKAREVALMILGKVGEGLAALPGLVADIFRNAITLAGNAIGALPGIIAAALHMVLDIAGRVVGKILDIILAIPRAVAAAIASLGDLSHVANLTQTTVGRYGTVPGAIPSHAAGGWVGMNGPEIVRVGEQGPEFIRPAGTGSGGGTGVTIQGVSERQILDMVERGLYFRLRRAAPVTGG
jgi:hypothetical protein